MPLSQEYNNALIPEDLQQISQRLREPREEELVGRQLFPQNNEYNTWAQEIGYDAVIAEGGAAVIGPGSGASDVPLVGETLKRETQPAVTIVSGVNLTAAQLGQMAAAREIGKGPSYDTLNKRTDRGRRFINEKITSVITTGVSDIGLKGMFDDSFYASSTAAADTAENNGKGVKESVAQGATGADPAAKRLWDNKTPAEIHEDLRLGLAHVNRRGLFAADTLGITPKAYWALAKPYSAQNPMSLLDVINETVGKGYGFFKRLLVSRAFAAGAAEDGYNGDNVDYMCIFEGSSEVAEYTILEEIRNLQPVYDKMENMEMVLRARTGGLIMYQGAGIYIGKGI